jgi:myo-inositol catabolism protein IolC
MRPVFALAFDHRNSFRTSFMRLTAPPTPEQAAQMVAAKQVVVDAMLTAAPSVTDAEPALLIDAEYGGAFVGAARAGGVAIAMPVEVSGQKELQFEHGGDFSDMIEQYEPDYAKVLVRYNADGDSALNARQRARLRELAEWLAGRPQRLMLELLVPPEPAQLAALGDDQRRYDREHRADLTARAIKEIGDDGVRPALWKLEGPESSGDARRISAAVHDLDPVAGCLVLGRGANPAAVHRWLATAARVPGFSGFAVGRTVWWDALREVVRGGDRGAAVGAIARNYLELVAVYRTAQATTVEEAS